MAAGRRTGVDEARGPCPGPRPAGSGLGVALAGVLLRGVDPAVELLAVLAAGPLVGEVARLLQALVDLLVVLVGELLGVLHESTHGYLLLPWTQQVPHAR